MSHAALKQNTFRTRWVACKWCHSSRLWQVQQHPTLSQDHGNAPVCTHVICAACRSISLLGRPCQASSPMSTPRTMLAYQPLHFVHMNSIPAIGVSCSAECVAVSALRSLLGPQKGWISLHAELLLLVEGFAPCLIERMRLACIGKGAVKTSSMM